MLSAGFIDAASRHKQLSVVMKNTLTKTTVTLSINLSCKYSQNLLEVMPIENLSRFLTFNLAI